MLILSISDRTYSLEPTPNDRFFEKLFKVHICRAVNFSIFGSLLKISWHGIWTEVSLSNMPSYYQLDRDDFHFLMTIYYTSLDRPNISMMEYLNHISNCIFNAFSAFSFFNAHIKRNKIKLFWTYPANTFKSKCITLRNWLIFQRIMILRLPHLTIQFFLQMKYNDINLIN